jgi:hypothetical protein
MLSLELLTFHLTSMPLLAPIVYLGGVYAFHQRMTKSEKPVEISKGAMLFYNFAQVVINAYVAYAIAAPLGGAVWGIGHLDSPAIRYGVYLHYLCKYLDMIDTLIIVLRKKSDQLSFLHLWHHSTIVVVWGWVVHTWPTAAEGGSAAYAYGAWINSCIHVIMYAYYGVAAIDRKLVAPIKKLITTAQLTQFASCIVHAISALFYDTTPVFYNAVQVLYHIGMLKLFLPLLLRKTTTGKKAPASADPTVPPTPSEKKVLKDD